MSERKVLNKYYPPDFDPALLPRRTRPKNEQIVVRIMLPMSICCTTCGEYLYRGKKFNARKETVEGEDYLGLKIFRLYVKCVRCSSELTFKTDPKNSDYIAEYGCVRNFEPWRDKEKQIEEAMNKRSKEEEGDAMKALENRTMDSKTEMDILDALDELKSMNARHSQVDIEKLPQFTENARKRAITDEADDEVVSKIEFKSSSSYVHRLPESDEEDSDEDIFLKGYSNSKNNNTNSSKTSSLSDSLFSIPPPKKKVKTESTNPVFKVIAITNSSEKDKETQEDKPKENGNSKKDSSNDSKKKDSEESSLANLFADYNSDED